LSCRSDASLSAAWEVFRTLYHHSALPAATSSHDLNSPLARPSTVERVVDTLEPVLADIS